MIESNEVKIAENADEAFWSQLKDKCVKDIQTHEREIIINGEIIILCNKKLSEVKNGK